jgi:hypothetical protein
LQVQNSADAGIEEFKFRSGILSLVRSWRMASRSDLSDLSSTLAECDEFENSSSCCSCVGPVVASPHSWSADCSFEVESGEVETLFYESDHEDALLECLTYKSLFELETFCLEC